MTVENKKKPTLEEALSQRIQIDADGDLVIPVMKLEKGAGKGPEPTEDEIVTQALRDVEVEKKVEAVLSEPTLNEIAEKAKTILMGETTTMSESAESNSPETGTIPVSSTDPQPATKGFTLGYREQPPQGKEPNEETLDAIADPGKSVDSVEEPMSELNDGGINLRRLIEYVHSSEFSPDWVRMHHCWISRVPSVIPRLTMWDLPNNVDVYKIIYETILMPGYIEDCWPSLKLVMNTSIDNVEWTAGVLTTIALFDVIWMIPLGGDLK